MNKNKCKREHKFAIKLSLFLIRKYLVLGLSIVFIATLNSPAQTQRTWKWVNQLGGPSWDISTGVVSDGKDNLYISGRFYETIGCDGKKVNSFGGNDIFLASLILKEM